MTIAIVGAGPAGLFCAQELLDRGISDITIIDMGKRMEARWCPETQACACLSCYVLEGQGGAGGFSDGKLPFSLMRGTQMEKLFDDSLEPVLWEIDKQVVKHAGPGVWYEPSANPPPGDFASVGLDFGTYPLRHVGSDGVRRWASGMSQELAERGVQFRWETEVTSFGRNYLYLKSRELGTYSMDADRVIIATGIQGIPWLSGYLESSGIELGSGPAGVGVRVEAPADSLAVLFDAFYDWKVVYEAAPGLTFRSFCCNQRGYVTNQWHKTMPARGVNGHSMLDPAQRSGSSNFAIIAKVGEEFADDPQEYVKGVVRSINGLTDGHTAVQTVSDFLHGKIDPDPVTPHWRTNVMARSRVDIGQGMPVELRDQFRAFITKLMQVVPSLDPKESLVYAPELKYPAKRVPVDLSSWWLPQAEVYVLGDATGYVDSFVAAAITGVVAARHISG